MTTIAPAPPTTVNAFERWDELIQTLKKDMVAATAVAEQPDQASEQVLGWFLTNLDRTTCESQSLENEAARLLNLKTYNVLDREKDAIFQAISTPALDHIAQRAKEVFDVPVAVILLVDAGRQHFIGKVGLDATETPRSCAFCAHAIQTVENIMIIPDATQDPRFRENPFVTGPFGLRYYAGAKITSPEGKHLGTVCVIDTKARPDGTTREQVRALKDLAYQAMTEIMSHWLFENM